MRHSPALPPLLALVLISTLCLADAGAAEKAKAGKPAAAKPAADKPAGDKPKAAEPDAFKLAGVVKYGEQTADFSVRFKNDAAVSFVGAEPIAVFDLKQMTWFDVATGQRATLDACRQWHATSKAKSGESAAKADPATAGLLKAMADPNLQVKEIEGGLTLSNAALNYKLTALEPLDKVTLARVAAFSRLSAYHTAITERKVPPDAALAVADELERRGQHAQQLTLTITTPKAPVTIETTLKREPLTSADAKSMAAPLRKSLPK